MRRLGILGLALALIAGSPVAFAEPVDGRFNLRLTPKEQVVFLAEMRVMLGSVQGIVQGIADEDREAIARFARLSGNRMARATPATVRERLPDAFKALGGPTHLLFEEIAIRAETDEMPQLTRLLGETLNQCMACHAAFRAR